nr:gametocyte-specific factor 1 homolog [Megalopta genalis]XP_033323849.1 gametocyte-specific factor 1 homolog [Megalopta genalis]XP_033323850.1 gametocyte-specific factor 1 homolog [Megalopta genalis]XP_033323851.1 gametocyte-specific factor 1 homolog [Megalopta genalis]XP_033323852.1 gametocyte-specific factor 1 homolog [Megalopta genalis]XP_033323853.1 gametocyte-specific factor 1 homolog [Megalopta genalis]
MDEIVTCPYDRSHRVSSSKLLRHLFRCKQSNSSEMKICCPFDAFHIINNDDLKQHIANCESSGNMERYLYSFESPKQLGTVPLKAAAKLTVPIMKDWEEEDVQTYEPWKNTENKDIIRCKSGGTRSQRRDFRLAERTRLTSLKKENLFKRNQTTCFERNPLKKYPSDVELIRNLRRMSLIDFESLLSSADLSNLHISKKNKFKNPFC